MVVLGEKLDSWGKVHNESSSVLPRKQNFKFAFIINLRPDIMNDIFFQNINQIKFYDIFYKSLLSGFVKNVV